MIESLVLKNNATLQTVKIDQNNSDFVLGEADLGTVPGTHKSYKFLNQIGSSIESTSLEERDISISGWVIGSTYDLLSLNKAKLNRLVNPLHMISLIVGEYQIDFKPDSSIKYSVAYKENNEVLCKFLIQGTCPYPMFTTTYRNTIDIASTLPKLRFPLIIPQNQGILMGLREPSLLTTIENKGDIDTGMVITITCKTSATNPMLFNIDTREGFKINKTLVPDEQIVMSTENGRKSIKGILNGVESSYLTYLDFDSDWLQLHTGLNNLKYDAEENPEGLEVSIAFQPKFLEVQ